MFPGVGVVRKRFSKAASRKRLYQLSILLAAGCLTTMTGGVVSPVFPEMVQQLQLDPKWAGMLVSTHALTSALCTPVMGVLADRIGKLKVMVPCLVLYAIFGISTSFLTSFPLLLLSRGLLGAASGGIAAAAIGLLSSLYEGDARSRVLGFATSAMTTAAIMFPLIGGWAGSVRWQYAFYLYGLGFVLAVIVATNFNENRGQSSSTIAASQRHVLTNVLRQKDVLTLYLLIGAAATIVYTVIIYTPLYLKLVIDAGPELNGFVLAIRAVGAATVSALGASRLAKRFGERGAIAFGFSLMALTVLTIPLLTELYLIVPTAVLFGVGFGVVTPNLYNTLAGFTQPEVRSSVLAIGTGFNSLGQFICPLFLGPVWKYVGLEATFFVATGIGVMAIGLTLMNRKTPAY